MATISAIACTIFAPPSSDGSMGEMIESTWRVLPLRFLDFLLMLPDFGDRRNSYSINLASIPGTCAISLPPYLLAFSLPRGGLHCYQMALFEALFKSAYI
ncbi:hypothetical protein [Neosynechococcus sphagnicola]|uniref:hypothetical protein n=1 Tax=Neosynechococcus sphagnicola TaxID=1501145 RepID=UPI00138E25F1|nr:hypothetical protein [Neosynechococcus sphagnicola]